MIKSISFLVLYSLLVFEEVGLRHNDAHPGNILLEKKTYREKPPIIVCFVDENTFYVIPIFFMVRVYDFDNSWVVGVVNKKLDYGGVHSYCNNYGMCNG